MLKNIGNRMVTQATSKCTEQTAQKNCGSNGCTFYFQWCYEENLGRIMDGQEATILFLVSV